jgi:cation-transporting ATPase 13A3/4/5
VLGLVIRTGFTTNKGNLVRTILYPIPYKYKFNRDAMITVSFMFILALVGFISTIPILLDLEYETGDLIL